MAERGVHAVVVLRRDELERILTPQSCVAMPRLHWRRVIQFAGAEMALAVRGAELSIRERLERFGNAEAHELLAVKFLQGNPTHERMRRIEQGPDHVVVRILEAFVVEAHAEGDRAEDLDVGSRFTGGGQRRTSELQIIMS